MFGAVWFAMACLGAIVALRGQRSRQHREFFYFTVAILVWMASNFFENDPSLDEPLRAFLLQLDFATALISGYWFFAFSLDFPRERVTNRWDLVWTPPLFWGVGASFSTLVAQDVSVRGGALNFEPGIAFPFYGLLLAGYYALGLVILARKLRASKGVERRQILFVLAGFAITVTIALVVNLLLQNIVSVEVFRIGVYSLVFIVFGMGYAIIKHRLFEVKILAAEAAAFLLSAVLLAQVFTAPTVADFVSRAALFLVVFILSAVFVRSVILEVRRREEIQRFTEQLEAANMKLEELSEMKSNFVSIASHQLRAPIGGVRGYLSMLREGDFGKLPRKVDDLLDLNLDSLNHTLHVIETFLNVTRLEAGKIDLQKEPVDICAMVRSIYKELKLTADRKRIRLLVSCPVKRVPLKADKEKLRNVLFNLVENALKYTERGTIRTTVVPGKTVEVRVTDTGIGIEKDEVPKLFAKFVRAGGGLRISHGSGLGLYIAKTLIEAHGGNVFVESPGPGKGSTFGFRIPAGRV